MQVDWWSETLSWFRWLDCRNPEIAMGQIQGVLHSCPSLFPPMHCQSSVPLCSLDCHIVWSSGVYIARYWTSFWSLDWGLSTPCNSEIIDLDDPAIQRWFGGAELWWRKRKEREIPVSLLCSPFSCTAISGFLSACCLNPFYITAEYNWVHGAI